MTDSAPPGRVDTLERPYPWDLFDSQDYFQRNYRHLRKDDTEVIGIVADFFEAHGPAGLGRAIDVGSGTNLYPALTMLPYAEQVTLFERAHSNREWLKEALSDPQPSWHEFWNAIAAGRATYSKIREPLVQLAERAEVSAGNVYTLKDDQYDLGTMFFVAESITRQDSQFRRATHHFVNSLHSRAPFAAAFMRGSQGYPVGGRPYPACPVYEQDVEQCLAEVARIKEIRRVESHGLHEGYEGMIVATGWKR